MGKPVQEYQTILGSTAAGYVGGKGDTHTLLRSPSPSPAQQHSVQKKMPKHLLMSCIRRRMCDTYGAQEHIWPDALPYIPINHMG